MDENIKTLYQIRNTLNSIEVRGRENLDSLLGCILHLDQVIQNTEQSREEAEPNENC